MKITNSTKEGRLEFFRELYESAKNNSAELMASLDRAMRQYRGSTEIDGSEEEALTVRNITYEIVESQISSDIPMPKADAASYSEIRNRDNKVLERTCVVGMDMCYCSKKCAYATNNVCSLRG